MSAITLQEAQARLPEIIAQLKPGEKMRVVEGGQTVAEIQAPELPKGIPILGRGKGMLISYVDDDEHLKDFEEYMP